MADGAVGTDAARIAAAIGAADAGGGVVVLADLGGAVLATQLAVDELLDAAAAGRVRISSRSDRGGRLHRCRPGVGGGCARRGPRRGQRGGGAWTSWGAARELAAGRRGGDRLGYLLGAVPFGLLLGRLTRGIDIREYGSHRTGATNALRTLGARTAALVFVLDVAKGVAAVLLARRHPDRRSRGQSGMGGRGGRLRRGGRPHLVGLHPLHRRPRRRHVGRRAGRDGTAGRCSSWRPSCSLVIWRSRYVSLGSVVGSLLSPVVVAVLAALGGGDRGRRSAMRWQRACW